jgi:hypothetical protein
MASQSRQIPPNDRIGRVGRFIGPQRRWSRRPWFGREERRRRCRRWSCARCQRGEESRDSLGCDDASKVYVYRQRLGPGRATGCGCMGRERCCGSRCPRSRGQDREPGRGHFGGDCRRGPWLYSRKVCPAANVVVENGQPSCDGRPHLCWRLLVDRDPRRDRNARALVQREGV